jgi:hypothetical protein
MRLLLTLGVVLGLLLVGIRPSTAVFSQDLGTEQDVMTPSDPRVDLYGNEISNAVGDYRVDPLGHMYERHAPDTALLHPAGPST